MKTVKKVKKVNFYLPSDAELVTDFNYISKVRTFEHCWLFISLPSNSVLLAYTYHRQSALGVKSLGSVADFVSRFDMLQQAIFTAYLSNS